MKTFNTKYSTIKELKDFIHEHQIEQSQHILLQIFTGVCDIEFIKTLVSDIKTLIPHIKIIGSTTSGEILDDSIHINTTILSFSLFKETKVMVHCTPLINDSYDLGINLIKHFKAQKKPKVAITFVDGLHVNGEEYMNAFNDYHNKLIVAGGLAGDNAQLRDTIVFTHENIDNNGAVVALLYNDNLHVTTNASFGWDNIGKTMTITKSHKNRVYEIDGIKARDIYAKYLGEDIATRLPKTGIEFPLILHREKLNIPRAVVKTANDGSLFFAGNLNEGDTVTFGYGDINAIVAYVKDISSNTDILNSQAIFIYSCMARKKLLADNIAEELIPLNNICSLSGFFTYGEFYTSEIQQENELLNQTMTILSLREGDLPSHHIATDILKLSRSDLKNHERNITLKAFAHLIRQTSKELEEINFKLQDRVKEEVKKSRKKDKAMLQQSKLAQMGEMISMIAHQWRQPLTSISANAGDLLIRNMLEKYDKRYYSNKLKKIDELSQHLSKTIDDFRGFYKEDKERQFTTLKEIVESALSIISSAIESDSINLKLTCKSTATIKTYVNEVRQVILNIITNAKDILLEHNILDPYISIDSYDQKDYVVVEISDNGGGVPPDILEKIFEPYFTTKGKSDGTGLGLYMSKTIIEDHCGGELSISNGDHGAIFTIKLRSHNV